jgi:hypothetical protein
MAPSAQAATYYACVKKHGGSIRIVSRSTKCKRSERKISFNSEGRNGLNGRNGQNGANGINGTNGTNGTTGFTSTLPKGQTEEGTWGGVLVAPPGLVYSPISFNIPLASAPASTIILAGGASTTACPGTVAKPSAISGHLCIYAAQDEGVSLLQFDPAGGSPGAADTFGTIVGMESLENKVAYGTWAVTG